MDLVIKIAAFLGAFLFMEGAAWFTHKYIMHGPLWVWHKSHHSPRHGVFEKNDLFAVVFSLPSIILCVIGGSQGFNWIFFLGLGIAAYGAAYSIFHDIIVHRRLKHKYKAESKYMKRIIRAHKIHHKTTTKEGAEAFGFLFALKKYDVKKTTNSKKKPSETKPVEV
jgi:beta-carotene 3-hydroxylase